MTIVVFMEFAFAFSISREFMDGYSIHKRRFSKYQKGGSRASSAATKSRPPSQSSSRPSSTATPGVKGSNSESDQHEINAVRIENTVYVKFI